MPSYKLEILIDGKDNATPALNSVGNGLQSLAGGFSSFMANAASVTVGALLTKGLESVAGAMGELKQGMIGGNAEFERYGVQFGVLLGSTAEAKTRLADLAAFGAATPFELPEVVRADKILQGFGMEATNAAQRFGVSGAQIRTIAGDTASGAGASFEEMSGYIGKFASGATGEAIARFQELGITTRAQLQGMFDKMAESVAAKAKMADLTIQIGSTKSTIQGLTQTYDDTNSALKANKTALEDAKGAYSSVKDQVSNLKGALDEAKRQLNELAQPKLAGMDEFDNKLFDLKQQADKAKLALIGLDKDTPQYDAAQANLDGINQQIDKLGLERDITYAPQLRALEQAAKAAGDATGGAAAPALTFEQALAAIGSKKTEIAQLTTQLNGAKGAMASQGATVDALSATQKNLERTLSSTKESITGNQDALKQLEDAYKAAEASMLHFDKGGALVVSGQQQLDAATGILLQAMQQKYGGMMSAQSATFEGMASNLADWKGQTLRTLGEPIFDVVRTQLQGLLGYLPTVQPQIDAFAQGMASGLKVGLEWLTGTGLPLARDGLTWMAGVWTTISPGVDLVASAIGVGLRTGLDWLTGTGLPAARTGLDWLAGVWATISPGVMQAAGTITGSLKAGLDWLTGSALPALQPGLAWLAGAWAGIQPGIDQVASAVNTGLRTGLDWLTSTGLPAARTGLDGVLGALKPVSDGFAEGGLRGALGAIPGVIGPVIGRSNELRNQLVKLALEGVASLTDGLADSRGFTAFLANMGLSAGGINDLKGTLHAMASGLRTAGEWVVSVGGWLQNDLLPPVVAAGQGFATMLAPHLAWLADFGSKSLMPILRDIGGFIGANLPGAISVVSPLLTGLADVGLAAVELALKGIATTWEVYLKPAFEAIGRWLNDITGGWDNLARGANAIKDSFGQVASVWQNLASMPSPFGGGSGGGVGGGGGSWGATSTPRLMGDTNNDGQLQRAEWNALKDQIGQPGGPATRAEWNHLPHLASGGRNLAGGLALVGENGPEIVGLPGGADVFSAGETGRMLGGSQTTNTYVFAPNINVQGSVLSEREMMALMREQFIDFQRYNATSNLR
jgi:septal ring factor EnvC (AmiA/AmiB activator)